MPTPLVDQYPMPPRASSGRYPVSVYVSFGLLAGITIFAVCLALFRAPAARSSGFLKTKNGEYVNMSGHNLLLEKYPITFWWLDESTLRTAVNGLVHSIQFGPDCALVAPIGMQPDVSFLVERQQIKAKIGNRLYITEHDKWDSLSITMVGKN